MLVVLVASTTGTPVCGRGAPAAHEPHTVTDRGSDSDDVRPRTMSTQSPIVVPGLVGLKYSTHHNSSVEFHVPHR